MLYSKIGINVCYFFVQAPKSYFISPKMCKIIRIQKKIVLTIRTGGKMAIFPTELTNVTFSQSGPVRILSRSPN